MDRVSKYQFFIRDNNGKKSCVVSIDPNYLVTFLRGSHSNYEKGKKLEVHSELDESNKYVVTVADISDELGFVILKSEDKLIEIAPSIATANVGEHILLCGYGNGDEKISILNDCVHSKGVQYFSDKGIFF
jgi:hypothetical protein